MDRAYVPVLKGHDLYDVPLSNSQNSKVILVVQRENMKHKTKLFYKDVNGEDTYLIAEGDSEAQAAENTIKEFKILQEIFGEDKLPIKNITRMDKIVDN